MLHGKWPVVCLTRGANAAVQVVEEMVEDEIYYRRRVAGLSQQANIQLICTQNRKERMFQKLGDEHVHVNPSTAKYYRVPRTGLQVT